MKNIKSEAQSGAETHPDPKKSTRHAAASGAQVGQNASTKSKAASPHAGEAQSFTSQVASAQGRLKAEIEKRSLQGADELSEVAQALHQSGRELGGNIAGPYVRRVAEQIDHASHYLRTVEPRDMVESVAEFAKRDPVLFLGGAFALGLFGSRFMKSAGPSAPQSAPHGAKLPSEDPR